MREKERVSHSGTECLNRWEMRDETETTRTLGVVAGLVDLVGDGVAGRGQTGSDGGVGVLGDLLVGLLGGGGAGSLDGLGNVVTEGGGGVRKREEVNMCVRGGESIRKRKGAQLMDR